MERGRVFPWLVVSVFFAVFAFQSIAFGDIHPEIVFARELYDLGYEALAEDHLIRTRRRDFMPEDVRIEAVRWLASLYRTKGIRAAEDRDTERKRRYYGRAIREYSRFLDEAGDQVDSVERHVLRHEMGELAYDMAIDSAENMRATVGEDERAEYREDALRWFGVAREALQEAQNFFLELRGLLEQTVETDEDRDFFHRIQRKDGAASMALGNAVFEHARLTEGEAEQQGAFEEAISIFRAVADRYPIRAFRYQAYRQIGRCYRHLQDFDKAEDFLIRALDVRETRATRWDRRLARLMLARTYNDWGRIDPGKYERALLTADALINDVGAEAEVRADRDSIDMVFAAWIERGRAMIGSARHLAQHAAQATEEGEEMLARMRLREARGRYQAAVDRVNEIAEDPDSRWARNARSLLDEWIGESGHVLGDPIEVRPGISTHMARGAAHYQSGRYTESINSFRKAIEAGDPHVHGATLIPEALYHMGLAYYYSSEPVRDRYYFYEAALCFEKIARHHAESDFAAEAAFNAQQMYGALFERTKAMVDRGRLPQQDLQFDGERYYMALENFRRSFPGDTRGRDMQFQAAEIARAVGDFQQAAGMYADVMQEHPRYYEAKFRAGYSLYLGALRLYEDDEDDREPDRIGELLVRAVARYQDYVDWFDENRELLSPDDLETVNRWIVRTKMAWGRMLVHDVWAEAHGEDDGAAKALDVLEDIEGKYMAGPGGDELRREFLPDVHFITIQAFRRRGQLQEAERFVDDLGQRFGQHELSSRAAAMLGYAYLQRRRTLEEEDGRRMEIDNAARQAGHYLSLALELDPDQTLEVYTDTAAQLYEMGEYAGTIQILENGLKRFPIDEGRPPGDIQLKAIEALGMSYLAREEWVRVAENAEKLLELENRINQETGGQQRNIDYRRNYARAQEQLQLWESAAGYWREVRTLAGRMETEEGRELHFEATLSLAKCYSELGNPERGHSVLAWHLLSSDRWLRRPAWGRRVREVYERHFATELDQLEELAFQFIGADPNLLRIPESRKFIQDMVDSHWPDRNDDLQIYLDRAEVEM